MDFNKLKLSFGYAYKGIRMGISDQQNIQIQFVCGLLVVLFAILLELDIIRLCVLLLVISQVLSLEIANTALEKYIDKLTPHEDKTIGLVKDFLAGAVLISVVFAVIIGIIIFYQPVNNII